MATTSLAACPVTLLLPANAISVTEGVVQMPRALLEVLVPHVRAAIRTHALPRLVLPASTQDRSSRRYKDTRRGNVFDCNDFMRVYGLVGEYDVPRFRDSGRCAMDDTPDEEDVRAARRAHDSESDDGEPRDARKKRQNRVRARRYRARKAAAAAMNVLETVAGSDGHVGLGLWGLTASSGSSSAAAYGAPSAAATRKRKRAASSGGSDGRQDPIALADSLLAMLQPELDALEERAPAAAAAAGSSSSSDDAAALMATWQQQQQQQQPGVDVSAAAAAAVSAWGFGGLSSSSLDGLGLGSLGLGGLGLGSLGLGGLGSAGGSGPQACGSASALLGGGCDDFWRLAEGGASPRACASVQGTVWI